MSYSIAQIGSEADGDAVLKEAREEKEDLEYKKTVQERKQKEYRENLTELNADLASTNAEIASLNVTIPTLSEGEHKRNEIKRLKRAEYDLFLLNNKQIDYGVVKLLQRELAVSLIDLQLAELDKFITAVEARKAALAD
jgi:Fe-S cluster assembly ATPase SufC